MQLQSVPKGKTAKNGLDIEEGRLVVTPDIALGILNKYNYERQRKITQQSVRAYAGDMKRGRFDPLTQITFGMVNRKLVLINGQHRLKAVVESATSQEFQVAIRRFASMAELHESYGRFDRGRLRSMTAALRASEAGAGLGIPERVRNAAPHAATIIGCDMRRLHPSTIPAELLTKDGKLEAIEPWWPFVAKYASAITCGESDLKRRMITAPVLATALVTLKHQPARAFQFWQEVAQENGTQRVAPSRALAIALRRENLNNYETALQLTAKAWNAFYSDQEVKWFRVDASFVYRLLGTPFGDDPNAEHETPKICRRSGVKEQQRDTADAD